MLAITCASLLAAGQLVPSDLMENCNQWKITYPTGSEDKTLCNEPNNEYFYVNDDDDAIVFVLLYAVIMVRLPTQAT